MSQSKLAAISQRWLGRDLDKLGDTEKHVLDHIVHRQAISTLPQEDGGEAPSFGARLADRVARVGGSWAFIGSFLMFLVLWCAVNIALGSGAFDAYPFIFLNLVLSMLAAIQAPVIMMSQNRQSRMDRLAATHDYEVNLKAELEIMGLHEKLDLIRTEQLEVLLRQQQQQLDLLTKAVMRLEGRAE